MLKKKLLTDRSGDLQDQILAEKSKEMAKEIDREVLWSMLQSLGWQRVMLPVFGSTQEYSDVFEWTRINCKNSFEHHKRDYIFESKQDAAWFALRWL